MNRGEAICLCGQTTSGPNNCTLCEDGSSLPDGSSESFPGELCAQTQVKARRDDPDRCIFYQGVAGVYCGCNNTISVDAVCQLCGDGVPLPNATAVSGPYSCIEHEFNASIHNNCSEHRTLYAEACCPTPAPTPASTASLFLVDSSTFLCILVAGFIIQV
jgi:hypothetical protein